MPACSPTASWIRRPRPPTIWTRELQNKLCSPSRAKRGRRERSRRSFRVRPGEGGGRLPQIQADPGANEVRAGFALRDQPENPGAMVDPGNEVHAGQGRVGELRLEGKIV